MDLNAWIAALEGEFTAMEAHQNRELIAELAEAENATITWRQRLLAVQGEEVTIHLAGPRTLVGTLEKVAKDWLLLAFPDAQEMVPLAAIQTIYPLKSGASETARKCGVSFASALRQMRRQRQQISLWNSCGVVNGFILAVRADHIDMATAENYGQAVTIPFAAIISIRVPR